MKRKQNRATFVDFCTIPPIPLAFVLRHCNVRIFAKPTKIKWTVVIE